MRELHITLIMFSNGNFSVQTSNMTGSFDMQRRVRKTTKGAIEKDSIAHTQKKEISNKLER